MKLTPTEIFNGNKIFFIGGTGLECGHSCPHECRFGTKTWAMTAFVKRIEVISPEEPAMRTRVTALRH